MKNPRFRAPACTFATVLAAVPFAAVSQESTAVKEQTQQMSKIKVQAAEVADPSTEGIGYAAPATTLGKDARSVRELPHSVTVVTRQQLTDQNINTIESALKNVTGVTIQRFDATGSYTQFIARGYAADTYQLDGLTVQTDTNGSTSTWPLTIASKSNAAPPVSSAARVNPASL